MEVPVKTQISMPNSVDPDEMAHDEPSHLGSILYNEPSPYEHKPIRIYWKVYHKKQKKTKKKTKKNEIY